MFQMRLERGYKNHFGFRKDKLSVTMVNMSFELSVVDILPS